MENDSSVNFQLTIRKQRTWKIMQLHRDVMPPAQLFVAASLIILSLYGKPRKIRKLQILAKIILHSICVLNYAKVYVKHNIFHKKIQIHDFPCSFTISNNFLLHKTLIQQLFCKTTNITAEMQKIGSHEHHLIFVRVATCHCQTLSIFVMI